MAKTRASTTGVRTVVSWLLCPASPTRITPVLVTAGAGLEEEAGNPTAMLLEVAEDVVDGDVMPPDFMVEPMPMPPVAGAALVMGAEEWVTVGDDWAGWVVMAGMVVAGAVVGALPPEVTVRFTDGLPEPHCAVTTYVPGETAEEIVAVPVKFSEPSLIEADPPTNAVEVTPLSVEPFVGQTPRIETVWPADAVPGLTISWP